MVKIYVWHGDGAALGLKAPEFTTVTEAKAKRDEWNEEVPGHRVVEIDEADVPNVWALPFHAASARCVIGEQPVVRLHGSADGVQLYGSDAIR